MAPRHSLCKLFVSGSALLALGLLLQPCSAQSSKAPKKPVAKEATRKKEARPPAPLQIAVVDMDRARAGHPLYGTKKDELAKWAREKQDELKKLDKTIQAKRAQLNAVEQGTEAYEKLLGEIQEKGYALTYRDKRLRKDIVTRRYAMLLELNNQVLDAVAELAVKRGIHLVLRRRVHHIKAPLGELMQRAESTDVLYAAASLDITQDVIDFLKTKYPPK